MRPNLQNLRKEEIIWLNENTCLHGHRYLSHWNCYLFEVQAGEKVAYWDIECSALKADWGIMLSYAIVSNENEYSYRKITKEELHSKDLDKKLVQDCAKDLQRFNRVITYYGTGFDLPFTRTRAVVHGVEFPTFGALSHTDVYYMVRNKFCLSRNRLANAEETLLEGKTEKTAWLHEHWLRAVQGNQKSLDYILDHNIKDVEILKKLHERIKMYSKETRKSI